MLANNKHAPDTLFPRWNYCNLTVNTYSVHISIACRVAQAAWIVEQAEPLHVTTTLAPPVMAGKKCSECGAHAVIRKDGCDYCTQCGHLGVCG